MDKNALKENKPHGSLMLPLSFHEMKISNNINILDCHWHEELEFLLVTEGRALFQIETSSYEVKKGEAIFINRDEIHAGFAINNSSCNYRAIVFNSAFLSSRNSDDIQNKYITPLVNGHFLVPRHIKPETPWGRSVLDKLSEIFVFEEEKNAAYEMLIKANLYTMLSKMLTADKGRLQHLENSENSYKTERLKEVLNYIHDNYGEHITVKQLAEKINMSEGHFTRFFKQMTNRTPIDYINSYRMNMAAYLLENSQKKILDISMEVGFSNFSYFINTFKKYMNCTPSKYLKRIEG
ncbi:helix-turn-helix transcriptional regulator [Clostridium sp. 19966]|uniref:AraC family transcriptional regulator n=1 Tax=Clostridium sp. 19966 TaxID=2768166 RepID=UPI0028DE1A7A|nr:AraC family transcriptional regulator [Clostridium sp. 19966]MDT8718613.1 helix-turn-helix transcriptional regulator [Clostridium sp. 19966]